MRTRLSSSLLLMICAIAFGPRARGDAIYEVVDLGTGSPVALNDAGQVVLNDAGRVILWQSGVRQELYAGSAVALNNRGDVAGRSAGGHAVLFRSGAAIDLGIGAARALNDLGVVLVDDGDTIFAWDDGATTEIPALEGTIIRAMNNAGWVVGAAGTALGRPFVFDGTRLRTIRAEGFASDINAAGAFVYTAYTDDGSLLYLRDGTTTTPLGALDPFDQSGQANALNDSNMVVGSSGGRGFLWQAGVMSDLNDLLLPNFQSEWTILSGIDINANGDILAVGYAAGSRTPRALLLRQRLAPVTVPEPSSAVLALVGLGLTAVVARRRRVSPRPAPGAAPER